MKYGYFDDQNREYVIERPDIPVSWTNYIGVKDMCTVISHNAGGYSFYKSAEHGRITRFRQNGIPLDRPGHYVYIRDDETGEFWSISWQPTGKDLAKAKYECRHGLSYSKFSCDYQGIQASQLIFIPLEEDVELWDVLLKNKSGKPRRLSVSPMSNFPTTISRSTTRTCKCRSTPAGQVMPKGLLNMTSSMNPGPSTT